MLDLNYIFFLSAYAGCAYIWKNCKAWAFSPACEYNNFNFHHLEVGHFWVFGFIHVFLSEQGETQNRLFIATERYKYCVLQWDVETSKLITRFKHEINWSKCTFLSFQNKECSNSNKNKDLILVLDKKFQNLVPKIWNIRLFSNDHNHHLRILFYKKQVPKCF